MLIRSLKFEGLFFFLFKDDTFLRVESFLSIPKPKSISSFSLLIENLPQKALLDQLNHNL